MPALAAVASHLELFRIPLREIKKKFTKSEIVIMAWRSSEVSHNMHKSIQERAQVPTVEPLDINVSALEHKIGDLGDKMTDENGNVDLRRLKGDEIMRVMGALGIQSRA